MFLSVAAFDFHRTGSFAHRTRRCLTTREMKAQGMVQNADGCWLLPVKQLDAAKASA
jgi:hypothetical protein